MEQCIYCKMKQKFNVGSINSSRCLQHTLINSDIFQNNEQQQQHQINDSHHYNCAQSILQNLILVEQGLNYYWQNLHEISEGSLQNVKKQISPINEIINKIKYSLDKLSYGSLPNNCNIQQIKPKQPNNYPIKSTTKSEKYFHMFSYFQNDQTAVSQYATDSIKQWVKYFAIILQTHQLSSDILPYQQQLEMKIFKQSLQKKYLSFIKMYRNYERKLHTTLTKLVHYMQKSKDKVTNQQLENDLQFLQDLQTVNTTAIVTQQKVQNSIQISQMYRLATIQATTIQTLLQQLQNDPCKQF